MPAPTAETLAATLQPLTAEPGQGAVLCDIDGTLAPIVARPEDAHVHASASRLLAGLSRRYGLVGCVSGRSAAEARRLVGVGGIAYVGSHGAEVVPPGKKEPELLDAFASWQGRVAGFVAEREHDRELKRLRVRVEDKGPIKAFHWRGAPDEEAAETWLAGVAAEAPEAGLDVHWGRKVLEIRPPVRVSKGDGIRRLLTGTDLGATMYGGDDATDLDAFDALDALVEEDALSAVVKVGVRSDEGPRAIVDRADLAVDGVPGFIDVLAALAE